MCTFIKNCVKNTHISVKTQTFIICQLFFLPPTKPLLETILKVVCWCEHSCLRKLETSFSSEVTWGHCSIVFMTRARQLQGRTWKIAVTAEAFPPQNQHLESRDLSVCEVLLGGVAVLLMPVPGSSLVRKLSHKAPHTGLSAIREGSHSTSAGPLSPFNTARTYFLDSKTFIVKTVKTSRQGRSS